MRDLPVAAKKGKNVVENRFKVNLYTSCSIKGPARQRGCCMWLLEYIRCNGDPVTIQSIIKDTDTTENRITLQAITEALDRIKKPCEIIINTQCAHISHSAGNNWPVIWQRAGWKNAKGKDVKNADMWEKYIELTQDHIVSFEDSDHSYENIMRSEVEKSAKLLREEGG